MYNISLESIHKLLRYFHVNQMPYKELDVTDPFVDDSFGASRAASWSFCHFVFFATGNEMIGARQNNQSDIY